MASGLEPLGGELEELYLLVVRDVEDGVARVDEVEAATVCIYGLETARHFHSSELCGLTWRPRTTSAGRLQAQRCTSSGCPRAAP